MSHREAINKVAQFLEDQKARKLEEAMVFDKFSDNKLNQIINSARLQQHSLVRGSIAELENMKRIDSARIILEMREKNKKPELKEIFADQGSGSSDKKDSEWLRNRKKMEKMKSAKLATTVKPATNVPSKTVKSLVKEALKNFYSQDSLDEDKATDAHTFHAGDTANLDWHQNGTKTPHGTVNIDSSTNAYVKVKHPKTGEEIKTHQTVNGKTTSNQVGKVGLSNGHYILTKKNKE